MSNNFPMVITISRQLGSGGALIGQKLAEKMNLLYFDREIIKNVSEKLGVTTENLEWYDETLVPQWQSIMNAFAHAQNMLYPLPEYFLPSSKELFAAESDLILKVAKEKSAVIIGRCGTYVLRNHPKHVSIFLHADKEFRQHQVQNLYGLSPKEAVKSIESTDKARARYIREFTGNDMYDVRQYHLSIDTGVLGLDGAENLIFEYLHNRFGDMDLSQRAK